MTRKIVLILLLVLSCCCTHAQRHVVFWTDNPDFKEIRIYHNNKPAGKITRAYPSQPSLDAEGCVSIILHEDRDNTWAAEARSGVIWKERKIDTDGKFHMELLSGSPTPGGGDVPVEAFGILAAPFATEDAESAGVMAVIAVVGTALIGTSIVTNDLYAGWSQSLDYGGVNFGIRNTMSRHMDLEWGFTGNRQISSRNNFISPARPDFDHEGMAWTMDMNALYNFKPRYGRHIMPVFNPHAGLASAVVLHNETDRRGKFGIGPAVGFSYGKRFKLNVRYKCLFNLDRGTILANQIEVGVSLKIKYNWWFE